MLLYAALENKIKFLRMYGIEMWKWIQIKFSFDFKSEVKAKGVFFLLLCTGLDDKIIFFSWSEIRQAEIAKLMVNFRNSHWTAVTREGKGCAQDRELSSALTKLLWTICSFGKKSQVQFSVNNAQQQVVWGSEY